MNFLPDVYVTCEVCRGARYNRETLDVRYQGKNIAQLLDTTVEEALELLENIPQIKAKLQTLSESVGLHQAPANRRRRFRRRSAAHQIGERTFAPRHWPHGLYSR